MEKAIETTKGKKQTKITQTLVLIFIIVAICAVTTAVNPRFLRIKNIINIFQQISILGIVASGVGMLLIAGHIDISVGSQISFMGVIIAMYIERFIGKPIGDVAAWQAMGAIPMAVVTTIAMGFVMGLINGLVVIKSKASSFIITLGFLTVYHGAALLASGGYGFSLYGNFELIGRGRIFNAIPIAILFFLGTVFIAYLVLKYFRYGRFLYAIGGNRKAAYVSGIQTNKNILIAYIVVGLCNSLAALILISRVGAATATTGDTYSLDALAAVIVGGVALTGGKGNALNIFLGVVLIGLIGNSLVIMTVNPYMRDVVIGLIIIIAVTISHFISDRS
jgi:ribose transport system permease protein